MPTVSAMSNTLGGTPTPDQNSQEFRDWVNKKYGWTGIAPLDIFNPSTWQAKDMDAEYQEFLRERTQNQQKGTNEAAFQKFLAELSKPLDPNDPFVAQAIANSRASADKEARLRGIQGPAAVSGLESAQAGALYGLEGQRRSQYPQVYSMYQQGLLNDAQLQMLKQDRASQAAAQGMQTLGQGVGTLGRFGLGMTGMGLEGSGPQKSQDPYASYTPSQAYGLSSQGNFGYNAPQPMSYYNQQPRRSSVRDWLGL